MAGYYYLVASLDEYSLSGDSKQLDFESIRNMILSNISLSDRRLLRLMLRYWDIQNFLNAVEGRENQYSYIGSYSKEKIAKICQFYKELVEFSKKTQEERELFEEENGILTCETSLSVVFKNVFDKIKNSTEDYSIGKLLFEEYYYKLSKSRNKFMKAWGEYDRSVRNISAAFEARKLGKSIENEIIGKGLICDSILVNPKADDFGLNEQEWVEVIIKILSSDNIIKKERGLDMIRWDFIESCLESEYFSINYVLGYAMKLTMISRWLQLDETIGREMFNKLVGQITSPDLINVEL